MKALLKDIATCLDGETYDVGRVLLIVGVVALILFAGIAVCRNGTFDPQNFGLGLGGLLGGGGAGLGFKAKTEPGEPPAGQG
jgi:hypothetical protein